MLMSSSGLGRGGGGGGGLGPETGGVQGRRETGGRPKEITVSIFRVVQVPQKQLSSHFGITKASTAISSVTGITNDD